MKPKPGTIACPFWQPSSQKERLLALLYKSGFLCGLLALHAYFTSSLERAGACCVALVFIVIEFSWTTIAAEDKNGSIKVVGWQGKLGHSSFAQFWSNIIWAPMMFFRYRELMEVVGAKGWVGSALKVVLFPFNIWWLEIVEGYILLFIFGRNVAWEYRGKFAYFHGTITLEYYPLWLGLGLVLEVLWDGFIIDLLKEVDRTGAWWWIVGVASIITLIFAPDMSGKAIYRQIVGNQPKKRGKVAAPKRKSSRKRAQSKETAVRRGRSRTARSRSKAKTK